MSQTFQSFEVKSDPSYAKPRVAKLRALMATHNIDGLLVPRADEHQGEYVPESAQRLGWLTGFTGSAGAVLILKDSAHLFVDGRYELQAASQTDPAIFTIESLVTNPPATWLKSNGKGLIIGFDPWLHTINEAAALRASLEANGGRLVALGQNLVDEIWQDRPSAPLAPVTIQPARYSGQEASDKIALMQQALRETGASATILSDPSSAAWLFNIRGKDVSNTPLPLCFVLLFANERPQLFIDERKLAIEPRAYLTQLATLCEPASLEDTLAKRAASGDIFMLDPALAAEKFRLIIEAANHKDAGASYIVGKDPARLPRAIKNQTELAGSRAAHERDGLAMVRFLSWLDEQKTEDLNEISAAQKLESCRAETGKEFQMPLEELSFDSISCSGPNGAIMHYRVNTDTNRQFENGDVYLIDSGGQYRDGTTDITRSVAIGDVSDDKKRAFTLVLKGMIAISTARFPKGTRGQDIDALARIALWKQGFDYGHGTGHGVGSYLSVHEGPQSISRRGDQELMAGMICSNEPGYYKPGSFGIRIENLVVVTPATVPEGGDLPMLGFETITFCPIDQRMIDRSLLVEDEINWLNDYHRQVREKLEPHTDASTRHWLIEATKPL
ncbi:aminopeptidase P family protein [Brucellaceae bacterium C25G]